MLNTISDYIQTILPARHKAATNNWISFNAPCCTHNGETADHRMRGGLHLNPDGAVSYHCFNCSFKTSYQPGRHLTFKFRKLLEWLGASDNEVKRLVIEAIRLKDFISPEQHKEAQKEEIVINARTLPDNVKSFAELTEFHPAMEYCYDRKIDLTKYNFYITNSKQHNLDKRVIIPFYWKNEIIGYTSRAIVAGITRYHNNYESNFVFNVDNQQTNWKFVIVVEGPFDAMAIDGVAVLGNDISETQADIIDSLGREVIVVADTDRAGKQVIDSAIKYGWSVSFPVWQEDADCKDINAAVIKYGKLFILKSIIDGTERNKLRIELLKKRIYTKGN